MAGAPAGFPSGAECYYPYATSKDEENYYPGGSDANNLTGSYANADWGVYNAISNGGNVAGLWRTLTDDEWTYLVLERPNASLLYGQARVNGVAGLVLLPDSWTLPAGLCFKPNGVYGYVSNAYNAEQWAMMEAAGAVLLPAAGYRGGISVSVVGQIGGYWSSTAYCYYGSNACHLIFESEHTLVDGASDRRYSGQSVRLVR